MYVTISSAACMCVYTAAIVKEVHFNMFCRKTLPLYPRISKYTFKVLTQLLTLKHANMYL